MVLELYAWAVTLEIDRLGRAAQNGRAIGPQIGAQLLTTLLSEYGGFFGGEVQ